MKRQRMLLITMMILVAVLIGSCAPQPTVQPTQAPQAQETQAPQAQPTEAPEVAPTTPAEPTQAQPEAETGAEKVLRLAYHEDFLSLDPTSGTQTSMLIFIRTNVFDGLLKRDESGEVQPWLAESWENIDETTWEFKLRQGVTFHNGEPFDARSVKFTFDHMLDPNFESHLTNFFFIDIESVDVIDDYTVQIKTKIPMGTLLANLTMTAMLPPEAYSPEAFTTTPIGTGPFKFDSWERGSQLTLVANDDYWGGRPDLDRVIWYTIPEATTRVSGLRAGDLDIVFGVPPADIQTVEEDPNLTIMTVPGTDTPVLSLGGKHAPYDDPKVRDAINMAIDRELIAETLLEGIAEPARSVISPDVFGFDPSLEPIPYDVEGAQALMAEAGYADGFEATMIVPVGAHPNNVDVALAIADMLSQININVTVDASEAGTIWDVLHSGEFDMFWNGWSTMNLDADFNMYRNFHSSGSREGLNSSEVDRLLEEGRATSDQEARKAIYAEVQKLLLEGPTRLPIVHLLDVWGVSDNVVGFTPRADRMIYLHEVTLK